ncbi:MAG: 5-(carboxyamino)imidazole ribonucleotide mutase [Oligoflexia bacterium]|nr:MAG: 5-(carboxyamino)imidazole ribonucleotide mutase [Oligoflexia bacterium]
MKTKKVAIIMGSETDLPTMKKACDPLKELKIPFEIQIVSAHRTPEKMVDFAKSAHENYAVIIAGAGGAAHLPGMVASLTTLPVIGVPVTVGGLKGLDALLSIAQMPKGVPVATVSVDNATNAGLLAARILGVSDQKIASRLEKFRQKQIKVVKSMNQRLKKK